jgi:glutathione synthase/RimK-type ligase-like ATP-grasp enzyme
VPAIANAPRIALATYDGAPDLAPDDQPLAPALSALGARARVVVWSDAGVDWTAFDAVVIRSCWNYHLCINEFHAWLASLEAARIRVMNSPDLVRWNSDKRYLIDLARRGVATIPTMVVRRGRPNDVAQVGAAEGWSRVVVKPAISASGYETYAVNLPLDEASRAVVSRVTSLGDTLVQPFATEVPRDGEYSFTFIDGTFSHATIKRAMHGEFRVQTEHGGSVETVNAPPELVAQAARAIEALPETPLYARVDGISRDGAFLLMELELIEPNLFLEFGSGAVERMASAIAASVAR